MKKRVSKKLKKSWRKNVDLSDVEHYLDDKLLEERLGVPFSERQDEELFSIDNNKKEDVIQNDLKSKKQKREELKNKPFKCYEILTARSKVPDPVIKRYSIRRPLHYIACTDGALSDALSQTPLASYEMFLQQHGVEQPNYLPVQLDPHKLKNRVRTPEERKPILAQKIEEDRKRRGILKKKEIVACRDRLLAAVRKKNVPKRGDFKNDLWGVDDKVEESPFGEGAEWLKPTTVANLVKNTGMFKKPPPKSVLNKPFVVGAIEVPHPGTSYNPSYVEHQALLKKIAETELEIIKQEKHLERVTTNMFSRVSKEKAQADWMSEMSEGLPCSEKLEVKDELSDDNEYRAINPPVQNKKKTLKKRRKLKEAKQEEKARMKAKLEKKKTADIYQLRFLQEKLKEMEAKLAKLRAKREKAKILRQLEPKKLSRVKFEPLEMEFNLASELSGNLRNVKPQGSVLKSRFNSLQKRNIIEPGSKHRKKKSKIKWFEKNSHKMNWE